MARYWVNGQYREYYADDFRFLIKGKFEDREIYLPIGYERCLQMDYGEQYMTYPSEEFRTPHHVAFYDTAVPYLDYLKTNTDR